MTEAYPIDAESIRVAVAESTQVPRVEMFPGFWRQTLVTGKDLMLCLFTWRKGATLPEHRHYHEQAGYVVSGAVELTVAGKTYVTRGGCSYFIPGNVPHSAVGLEDSLVIDAFSPPREEYKPPRDDCGRPGELRRNEGCIGKEMFDVLGDSSRPEPDRGCGHEGI